MAITGAFALIGVTEGLRWIDGGQKANREAAVVPVADDPSRPFISQSQFAKISQLEEFIGGKDEWALRSLFDLQSVLQKNISTQNIRMNFIQLGKEKEFLYNNYSDNGSFIFWAKEGHFTTGLSGVHIEAGPKDVLFLVTTEKFQAAQKQLIEFMNSALIPQNIKVELSAFNVVLNQDTELMMRVMDERMHQDENYFLHALIQDGSKGDDLQRAGEERRLFDPSSVRRRCRKADLSSCLTSCSLQKRRRNHPLSVPAGREKKRPPRGIGRRLRLGRHALVGVVEPGIQVDWKNYITLNSCQQLILHHHQPALAPIERCRLCRALPRSPALRAAAAR